MKPGSSFGNLILSGSHWNVTTITSVRKKRLAAKIMAAVFCDEKGVIL
jgi:hypothetical protein